MTKSSLTPRQASSFLKVGLNYVYRLLYEGRLKGHKAGRTWEIDKASVERYNARRRKAR